MLDAQRQRAAILRDEVCFTRRILIAHLILGFLVATLLAAHGVLLWALGTGLWYLLTIIPLQGMMSASACCRHILGTLFLGFSGLGIFFLTQVEPTLVSDRASLIPPEILPFWLGGLNLLYALAGACLIMHRKVKKAVSIGFSLW